MPEFAPFIRANSNGVPEVARSDRKSCYSQRDKN